MIGSGWPDIEKSDFAGDAPMDLRCADAAAWEQALSSYTDRLSSLSKPDLLRLDDFYRNDLPLLLRGRHPAPFITKSDLSSLMRWKLARGKWRSFFPIPSLDFFFSFLSFPSKVCLFLMVE